MKKTNWLKKADDEFSRIIREVGECEICGRKGKKGKTKGWFNLDAHHIIKRTYREYRFDLSNGICLCVRCHKWEGWSPHQDNGKFLGWLRRNRHGQWLWYKDNVTQVDKTIGISVVKVDKIIHRKHTETYRQAYERLREVKLEELMNGKN